MLRKISQTLMLLVLFICVATQTASATADTENQTGALAVRPIIPDNQRDKSKTYFDLHMTPGQKQTLEVELTNNSTEEIEVELQTNDATTNNNGIVEYSKTNKKRDVSLKTGFSEIATTEEIVKVPAKTTKKVAFQLAMPQEQYDGDILGGLYIKQKDQPEKTTKDQQGNAVVNRFAYTIGVVLNETDAAIPAELRLLDVKAAQTNYRNSINATIQNTAPTIIKELKIKAAVYRKGAEKPLLAKTTEHIRMAPNSHFDYALNLDNKPFSSGTYLFKATASLGEQKWQLEKEFKISSKEAKTYNEQAVELEDTYPWYFIYLIGALLLIFLTIIGILFYKLQKGNKSKKRKPRNPKNTASKKQREPQKKGKKQVQPNKQLKKRKKSSSA
jgi:hypothetical protein